LRAVKVSRLPSSRRALTVQSTVALIARAKDSFPDNWIYVHDPAVKVGRVQNFRSCSTGPGGWRPRARGSAPRRRRCGP
jgi:hypothetical protein